MKELFYLSHEQIARIKRYFPRSHGIPRVDDRRVVSGIIYVIKHGLQWKDAPREVWTIQNSLQSFYPLEPIGCL